MSRAPPDVEQIDYFSRAEVVTLLDPLDGRILAALRASPRAGVLTLARELGVARGTVQARLDRLTASGVVTGYGPDIDPAAIGYRVTGFVTLEITQGRMDDVVAHLAAIPQLVEAHMVTGAGDLLCRVVATDNDHLGAVLAHILEVPGIARTTTVLALAAVVPFRLGPALEAAVGGLP